MNKINGVIGGNSSPPSIKLFNKSLNFQAMNSHDPSTGPMINQNNQNFQNQGLYNINRGDSNSVNYTTKASLF
jgi:hypothetical protein